MRGLEENKDENPSLRAQTDMIMGSAGISALSYARGGAERSPSGHQNRLMPWAASS